MSLWRWLWKKAADPPPPPPRHSSDYLRAFAEKVGKADLSRIPLQQRCLAVQHLQNHIMSAAENDDLIIRNEDGTVGHIRPEAFQQEIAALKKLLESLAYSPALTAWLERRRHEFVTFLHQHFPPGYLEREWEKQNLLQRVRTVSHIMKEQCRMYREGAMDFFPSRVVPFISSGSIRGYTMADPNALRGNAVPDLYIARSVLERDKPYAALEVAHHEQIHIFLMQMAMAANRHWMPDDHPLRQDARIKLARVFNLAASNNAISEGYYADPEEIVCHTQDDLFIREYYNIPFWQRVKNLFGTPDPL